MQDIFTNIKSDMWLLLVGRGGGWSTFFQISKSEVQIFFCFFLQILLNTPQLCSKGHNTDLHIINNEIKSHVKKII